MRSQSLTGIIITVIPGNRQQENLGLRAKNAKMVRGTALVEPDRMEHGAQGPEVIEQTA